MSKVIDELMDYAKKGDSEIITTLEAFHKDPTGLYNFLQLAADNEVPVTIVPIKPKPTVE